MGANLDLYIDTSSGNLVDGGSVIGGSIPTLTRNDSYNLRLRLLEKNLNGSYDDIDFGTSSLKVGIGNIGDAPTDGAFKLFCNGVTSSEIPYNATAACLFNAISNNASTVSIYGGQTGYYLVTATQPNTAMSFSSDTFTLFPSSSAIVSTRRNPSTGIYAQQTIQLLQNPAVYSDTFSTASTANAITLSNIQDGSATKNETYELSIGPTVRGGLFSFNYGGNSTTGIAPFTSAITVQTQLASVTGIGTNNISVQENGKGGYIIQFAGLLGLQNITTQLILDASGVDFIPLKETSLTLNTAELADIFASEGTDSITPTLEIELTQSGSPKTIYQGSVTIRKDLISAGSFAPSYQSSYYTAAESDARYVSRIGNVGFYSTTPIAQPANTSVVSALVNLGLVASSVTLNDAGSNYTTVALTGSVVTVYDNVPFVFGTANGTKLGTSTAQKIGFFNSTPIVQPSSTNVLSALTNLGLIASSVTLGNVITSTATNIDATNRKLYDGSIISIEWGDRTLKSSGGTTAFAWSDASSMQVGNSSLKPVIEIQDGCAVSVGSSTGTKIGTATSQKLAFYGSTPTQQPTGTNVVSNLIQLGLNPNSTVTQGVLPLSVRTITTTASLNFGSVGGNSTAAITVSVTGVNLNDVVLLGLPNSICQGLAFAAAVDSADVVQVDAINATNSALVQSAQTFRILAIGY